MTNNKGFEYKVEESGRGEFHTYDVVRRLSGTNYDYGRVVSSFRWKFIAEQVANFLSQADDRDEYISNVVNNPDG